MWDELGDLRRAAKRDFRRLAVALILQETLLIASAYAIQRALARYLATHVIRIPPLTPDEIYDMVWNTGVDMIAASLVGLAVVLVFLGGRLRRETPAEPIGVRRFLIAVVDINGMQLLSSLISIPLENFVDSLGYSLEQAAEISSGASVTVSMFLYSVIIAPLVEEAVFRGAVLRWLEPWGRGFALAVSALLFGLMHGNLVQFPTAVACGLVFGYVSQRFSLKAAVAAHAANNLLVELIGILPDEWELVWGGYSAMMLMSGAYVIYWALTHCRQLVRELRGEGFPVVKWFFTSIPVLLLLALYIVRTLESAVPV